MVNKKCFEKNNSVKYLVCKVENRSDFRAGEFQIQLGSYLPFRDGVFLGIISVSPEDLARGVAYDCGYNGHLDEDTLPQIQEILYVLPTDLVFLKGALHKLIPLDSTEQNRFEKSLEQAVKESYEIRAIDLCKE